jgi:hypothetical protein
MIIKNAKHPFMQWLVGEPDYSGSIGDRIATSLIVARYNNVFRDCGFPIRIGEQGILVQPSTYEDVSPIDETTGVGRVFCITRTVLTSNGIVCMEQPEAGLHPSWHGPLAMLLMKSVTGEL